MSAYLIKREGSVFSLDCFPWEKDYPAKPRTEVTVSYDETGYGVHFVSWETHLRAVQTEHNTPVCEDSCMELFMKFAPDSDDRYLNIEINPNGVAYGGIAYCREKAEKLAPADLDTLDIKTAIFEDRWEIDYRIPVAFIQKYIPTYQHQKGARLCGNFYKCGDLTDHTHYGCFAMIDWPHPDYHRPEFFADFVLD